MKIFKRLLSLLLVAVIVGASCAINVVSAAGPTVSVQEKVATFGQTVDLTVSIADNPGFTNFEWIFKYDKTRLELVSIKSDPFSDNLVSNTSNSLREGWGYATIARQSNYTASGALITLTFKVKANAPVGEAKVEVVSDKFNASGSPVNAVYLAGGITVTPKYTVTVQNGTIKNGSSTGQYFEGETVTIAAKEPAVGKLFDKWVVYSGNVVLANKNSATTTFTMPAGNVTVRAVYKRDADHVCVFGTEWVDGGDGYHYHVCECGEMTDKTPHRGGEANCQSPAICVDCGAAYGSKDSSKHTGWPYAVSNKNGTHDLYYSCCYALVSDDVACSGGEATCTEAAICDICKEHYGEKNPNNHSSDEFYYEQNGAENHKKFHKCCDALVGTEEHGWGDDNICDQCGYDKTHVCSDPEFVSGKDPTCTEAGSKPYYVCSCGQKYYDAECKNPVLNDDDLIIPATGHKDANGDGKCDECGKVIGEVPTEPEPEKENNYLWIIIIVIIIVVLAIGFFLFFLWKKKKSEEEA